MEKIVYLPQGTGTAIDSLNEMLSNGWKVMQMQTASSTDDFGCFIWIKKEESSE